MPVPKSSAEILAAAKKAPPNQASQRRIQPRKLKTNLMEGFAKHLTWFSAKQYEGPVSATSLLSQAGSATAHPNFIDPVTPQTLQAALEIKEMTQMEMEPLEDSFNDEPAWDIWVTPFNSYILQFISCVYLRHLRVSPNPRSIAYQVHNHACRSLIAFWMCWRFYDAIGLVLSIWFLNFLIKTNLNIRSIGLNFTKMATTNWLNFLKLLLQTTLERGSFIC